MVDMYASWEVSTKADHAHLDAFVLEEVQRSIGRRLLREDTSRVKQAEDTAGHGDG
jgi:hypothetical protein